MVIPAPQRLPSNRLAWAWVLNLRSLSFSRISWYRRIPQESRLEGSRCGAGITKFACPLGADQCSVRTWVQVCFFSSLGGSQPCKTFSFLLFSYCPFHPLNVFETTPFLDSMVGFRLPVRSARCLLRNPSSDPPRVLHTHTDTGSIPWVAASNPSSGPSRTTCALVFGRWTLQLKLTAQDTEALALLR